MRGPFPSLILTSVVPVLPILRVRLARFTSLLLTDERRLVTAIRSSVEPLATEPIPSAPYIVRASSVAHWGPSRLVLLSIYQMGHKRPPRTAGDPAPQERNREGIMPPQQEVVAVRKRPNIQTTRCFNGPRKSTRREAPPVESLVSDARSHARRRMIERQQRSP